MEALATEVLAADMAIASTSMVRQPHLILPHR